ncbi:MAG: hypothetical protein Q4B58_07630 [Bacteroidales bacterium]|nr:hypothetical protein [Bacteroidales bacterium]
MKKIFITITALALTLAMPQQAEGQSFLNKMKEKAQQAAQAANKKMEAAGKKFENSKMGSMMKQAQEAEKSAAEMEQLQADAAENIGKNDYALLSKYERKSTFAGSWDDAMVTPSSAKFPVPLFNELPALPSAAEIANPTEEAQKQYYMAIQRVALRASMLMDDETCNKEQAEMAEQHTRKMLKDTYRLTDADIDILFDEKASEKEKERIGEKMRNNLLEGLDVEAAQREMDAYDNMSKADQEATQMDMINSMMNQSMSAADAVYDKHDAELRKYCGLSAAEMKKVQAELTATAKANMAEGNDSDVKNKAFEAKVREYQSKLSAEDQKAAKAFEKQMQQEIMEAMKSAKGNGGAAFGNAFKLAQELQERQKSMMEFGLKQSTYNLNIINAYKPFREFSTKAYAFADADRKHVMDLREKIFSTDDPAVYNPLYQEAMGLIKSYRVRAAEAWRAELEQRYEQMKANLPALIKYNRQAIEDDLIPECMLYRIPLNAVLDACGMLAGAYSEIPVSYPPLYKEEVVKEITLQEHEYWWWGENFVATTLDNVLSGKTIFKSVYDADNNSHVYQYNNGKWVCMDNVKPSQKNVPGVEKAPSQSWTSDDGLRTVRYVQEGGYFSLPEGDTIYPVAIGRQKNCLVWADIRQIEKPNGEKVCQIIKCTYML